MKEQGKLETLREMYRTWPFFRVTMDLIEMVLAKADPTVARLYEKELVEEQYHAFGEQLRKALRSTVDIVLEVTEHPDLLTSQTTNGGQGSINTLKDKLAMRSIYLTPLNIIQVENLKRLRDIEDGKVDTKGYVPVMPWAKQMLSLHVSKDYYHAAVSDTLIITMKGIAAGMQNTG